MKPIWSRRIHSPAELEPLVRDLVSRLEKRSVVLLEGEVGSGKTETVKAVSRVLGLREIASPSFAIHHRYQKPEGAFVDHLDLYRLESEDDLESTGFWDLFSEPEGLILIEWADRLNTSYLPPGWTVFRLQYEKGPAETERLITLSR